VRNRAWTTIAVLASAGAMVLAGCSNSSGGGGGNATTPPAGNSTPAVSVTTPTGGTSSGGLGGSGGSEPTYTIGFIGALSGAEAQLGINEKQGAELAIAQANASGKYKFKVALDPQDSEGDPAKAPAAATALISNPAVIAVIGPAFSGESLAVNKSFCSASPSMPIVTASASNATLEDQGWKCWHRIIANDNVEGTQGADWLARTGAKKVFVLNDLSAYGKGVADTMAAELKKKSVDVVTAGADATTTKNYAPIAQQIVASGADAMFYGGYDAQTALLAKALQAAGFKGRMVSGNGSLDSTFTKNAGPAGYGWYFTCGCQDSATAPQSKAFVAAYKAMFKEDPSTYSPEAFDAANLYINVMNTIVTGGGTPNRTTILAALATVNYQGITADIKFLPNGEVVPQNLIVNLFEDKKGTDVGLGDINKLN
jgi:branched-chain amino acid transport system substrate-binding protein